MKTRILLTGAAGFFGSHFVEHLLANTDWEIVGMVRTSKVGWLRRLFDQEGYDSSRVKLVHHDFRWPIPGYVKSDIGHVDYICHAGAETHVDRSIENPDEFVQSNVIGTLNMLNYARGLERLRLLHFFSTDEVYGPALGSTLHAEMERYNPTNPYAAAKAGGEMLVNAFGNTYGLPVLTTNTMNLIGERQHPEKMVPKTIRALINGETLTIHADATRTNAGSRFYLHCRNAADAVLFLLGQKHPPRERYNIVGEREIDNLSLAQMIAEVVGLPLKYELVSFHASRPGHDLRYALDGSKLYNAGYRFPVAFEESLERTVRWTLKNPSWLIP